MTVMVSSFGQIEQDAHQIGKFMRKGFLEKAVVELVYKPRMFENVRQSLNYDSNFFFIKHIYGHQHRSLYPARAAHVG